MFFILLVLCVDVIFVGVCVHFSLAVHCSVSTCSWAAGMFFWLKNWKTKKSIVETKKAFFWRADRFCSFIFAAFQSKKQNWCVRCILIFLPFLAQNTQNQFGLFLKRQVNHFEVELAEKFWISCCSQTYKFYFVDFYCSFVSYMWK